MAKSDLTHKSALKAHRQSVRNAIRNSSIKSRIKTFAKKADLAIKSGSIEDATKSFRIAESEIMKSVSKGVIKLNTASRKVSKLARRFKALEQNQAPAL